MTIKKLEELIERGYDMNVIFLLYEYKKGEAIVTKNEKIICMATLMARKELLIDGRLSGRGEELLAWWEGQEKELKTTSEKQGSLESIFDRVQERIVKLTGKKQVKTEIFGKTYNYLPSKYDFISRLKTVANKYKLKDLEKLEKVIMHNIEQCNKKNKWFPLLIYYFSKNETSSLASDYESWEESGGGIEQEKKSNETII